MTNHDRYLQLAVAGIDFTLTPAEERFLAEHGAVCASCNVGVRAMRGDAQRLADLPDVPARAVVRDRIVDAALAGDLPGSMFSRPLLVLATALLLVALAAATVAVGARLLEEWRLSRLPVPTLAPAPVASESPEPIASVSPQATPSPAAEPEWIGYRQVLVDTIDVRDEAGIGAEALAELASGTIVSAWGPAAEVDGYEWYLVHYGTLAGWVATGDPTGSWLGEVPAPVDVTALLRVDIFPDVIGDMGTLTLALFADGRLVRPSAEGLGWTEQRLTADGAAALLTAANEDGLLDESAEYPIAPGYNAGFVTWRISAVGDGGPVTVTATNASEGAGPDAVRELADRLVSMVESLPDDALVDSDIDAQPYVATAYNLVVTASEGELSTYPTMPEFALWLEDADLPLEASLLEIGEAGGYSSPDIMYRCAVVDAATASELRKALYTAGYEAQPGAGVMAQFELGWRDANGLVTINLSAVPPDEAPDFHCSRYGF